jgi:hypothetical protein
LRNPRLAVAETSSLPSLYATRVKVTDWLNAGTWHVVVGVPGSGKSALLRTLVLDVFADEPRFISGMDRWHELLPVWLPFAFWTQAARHRSSAVSVLDGVHAWLNAYNHGHLWPMIEKALRDERVLLVVDGLDEWASSDLARLCIDRLEVFAGTKHVNLVASSRPFSTAELPLDGQRWRRAELAPLDPDQRQTFIYRWLSPLIAEPRLAEQAHDWAREIDSAAHLRELSDLPLFLLLLLRTREQRTEFPEDLYAVLADAVTRLIGEHRRRKIDAAAAPDAYPSTGDVRKVSAAAAEHMHLSSTLSISDDDLRELFQRTFADSIGYPADEAYAKASTLVNALSPGVGLMIRPAPDEIRFFHRSILDFLAAERLLALPSSEQIMLFQNHLTDRRWSQVLRFLIHGLTRPAEIAAIFDALESLSTYDPLLREHLDSFAADVVVNAGQADASTRRRLFDQVINEVETGERTAHRAQLLDKLSAGLARPEIRAQLMTRFTGWLHAIPDLRWEYALRAVSSWEPDSLLLDVLWRALLSDNEQVQRVATQVLGEGYSGNSDVARRLAELATTTHLLGRQAAAIEALAIGWPQHGALDALVAAGRDHADFAVRHAAIAADLRRGHVTDANRSALIELVDRSSTSDAWSNGLMELMFTHYPDDQTIFEHYVSRADPTANRQGRYGHVSEMYLILKGYTTRPEAKEIFLRYIAADRPEFQTSPSNLTDRLPWKEIGEVYQTDGEVVAAVERLVDEYGPGHYNIRDIYFCSLVARTVKIRNRLIAFVESKDNFGLGWAIKALLKCWPDDTDARTVLSRLVDVTDRPIPDGAIWYLPDIVTGARQALEVLERVAVTVQNQEAVVFALSEITKERGLRSDTRVTAILDQILAQAGTEPWNSPEANLYRGFPEHPGVRELALTRIDGRDAPIDGIAYGFRADQEMREHVAARLKPLSAPLRGRLVEGLADASLADAGATRLLSRHDAEPDPTVKLIAANAYAGRLAATDSINDAILEEISEQARARGWDHHERRAAAFGALARLGRLDKLTEQVYPPLFSDITLFFRLICRYWEEVIASFGNELPGQLGYTQANEFWQNILAVAHDYPSTRGDLAALLEREPALVASEGGVTYLSKIEPGSDRLWEAVTDLLRRSRGDSYMEIRPVWLALNILEDQFAEDPRTSAWLDEQFSLTTVEEAILNGQLGFLRSSFGTIAALARLRPSHSAVPNLRILAQRVEGQPWRTFNEWTELATATTANAREFVNLAVEISRIVRMNDSFPEYIYRPLAARLRRDPALADALVELVPELSGSAFGIAVRLLSLSARVSGQLVAFLRLNLSAIGGTEPITFDPLFGQVRRREMLVLDILDTIEN